MEIIDGFLDHKEFDELKNVILSDSFDWNFIEGIDFPVFRGGEEEDIDKFQFEHFFYVNIAPCSNDFNSLIQTIKKLLPESIRRVKANLLTRTSNIIENKFHVDMDMSEEKLKQWKTSIFYVNTNNGYTKFEDGTIVESVANRMVIFPANIKHTGTTCSDEKRRVVINFNFYPSDIVFDK